MHRLAFLIAAVLVCTSATVAAQEQHGDIVSTGEAVGTQLPRPSADLVSPREVVLTQRRPAVITGMYVSLAGLNALDLYSTSRALANGAREANPIVAAGNGNIGASLVIKTAATGASIYFVEKLWRKTRAGAIATALVVNGATAAVVARNFRNAR